MLLADPWSTTGLAVALGVTPSAVNQQLRLLHRTGLLMRRRHGRSVLYQRSSLADAVLLGEIQGHVNRVLRRVHRGETGLISGRG